MSNPTPIMEIYKHIPKPADDMFVLAAGTDMIYRVTPEGQPSIFLHDVERECLFAAANCAFGGPQRNQLYISNLGGHISRIRNLQKGQPLYHQRSIS